MEASAMAAESESESAPTLEHTATGQVEVRGSEVYTEVPSDHAEQTKSVSYSKFVFYSLDKTHLFS